MRIGENMLRYLLEKEFKQLVRNRFMPRVIVVMPLAVLLIVPLIANFDVKNLNLSVVDGDRSPLSRRLVAKVSNSGYFIVTDTSGTYRQALDSVEEERADIILEIPPGFERNLVKEGAASLLIAANTVNGTKGGLGSAYMSSIVSDFNIEVIAEMSPQSGASIGGISIDSTYRYNPHLEYPVFMIPALMVMMLTMLCGFLPALNIVMEKQRGTIEQMNVTPVRRSTFILSKLIPYWVTGFVVLSVCFVVAWLVHDLVPRGSYLTIYGFSALFVLAISGLGLVISNYASSVQQAMFMMFFFVLSLIFLSGLYTPIASMPGWAQVLSIFSPLKYLIVVMRQVFLIGAGAEELSTPLVALGGFALFFNGWAIVSYKKSS